MADEEQMFDPAQSVANAAAVASGAGTASAGQVAATNGVTPQAVQQQNIRIGQPYDMTQQGVLQLGQEDFYPGPGVAYDQYDTGLVLTPRSPQTPMGAISKAAALLQQRQQRLDQMAKDFDLYAGIGSAADPYDQNFKKIAVGKLNAWRQGVADAYTGGDIKQANRLIYTTPELRDQWRGLAMQLEAMGQESKWVSKEADSYLKQVAKNEIEFESDTVEAAQKMLYALNEFRTEDGSQGDVMKQLSANREFQQLLSRDKFFKEYVVPGLEHAKNVESIVSKPTKNGTTWFITTTTDEDYDNLIGEMATQLSRVSGIDYAEAERYMKNRLGRQHKEKLDTASIFVPGGSASIPQTSASSGQSYARSTRQMSPDAQKIADSFNGAIVPGTNRVAPQSGIRTNQINASKKYSAEYGIDKVIPTNQRSTPQIVRVGKDYLMNPEFERMYGPNGEPSNRWYITGDLVESSLANEFLSAEASGDDARARAVSDKIVTKSAPLVYMDTHTHNIDLKSQFMRTWKDRGLTDADINNLYIGDILNKINPRHYTAPGGSGASSQKADVDQMSAEEYLKFIESSK